MIPFTQIVFVGLVAFLISLFVTPLVIRLSKKFGMIDDVHRSHPAKIHVGDVPRAGGLAMFLSIAGAAIVFLDLTPIVVGILLGACGIMIMGLLDDKYDLSPRVRLVANFLIVGLVILTGLGVPYITNPLGGVIQLDTYRWTIDFMGNTHNFLILSNIFALLWIVGMMNFVSWSSGVDGQLSGFVGISSIIIGIMAFRFSAHEISSESVGFMAFIVAGAYLGFLPWHFYPQKIMPGYGGGALAGFMLGVLSILSWSKIGTVALVLSVPLVDALYIMIRRIAKGTSPLKGDKGHFHHRLLSIGWGKRRVAIFYWVVSALFGCAALFFESERKIVAFIVSFLLVGIFIFMMDRIRRVHAIS